MKVKVAGSAASGKPAVARRPRESPGGSPVRCPAGWDLDPQRATKPPGGIVGLGAVVVQEDAPVTAVTEDGAAEPADVGRRPHPARSLGVELPEFLQRAILVF